ncbi:MAG: pyridoxal 5'-phosphate synthase glutaminase subunit PdxT [Capsulimonadales bacterium]|nr:pyridoxal 5'-phosphate synthase glutaminase subunit PdxT [Capsulimonadales bacterium]
MINEKPKTLPGDRSLIKGDPPAPVIGVLALQGDFDAHLAATREAGGDPRPVRTPAQIRQIDALILPGGESTTIGKLMARYGLDTAIREAHADGMPIFGTCAGMILLARHIARGEMRGGQNTLGLMDIAVERNAFGRQVDSFEADIDAPDIAPERPLRGVFIRAPIVTEIGPDVEPLATIDGRTVLVRQRNLLAAAFHPELTGDHRVHRFFLSMVASPEPNRGASSP